MYAYLADKIIRYAKPLLILWGVIAVVCATNLPRLGFDFTPQQLFRSSSDAADYREIFAERFGREDNLVFVIVEADEVFQPDVLQFVRDFTVQVRENEFVRAADSIATMEIPRPGDSPGVLATEPLIAQTGAVTEAQAESLETLAASEPLLQGTVVSRSGGLTAVLIWIREDVQDVRVLSEALDSFRAQLDAQAKPEGVSWELGGVPYLRVDIVDELKFQQLTFVPGTAVAYMLILLLLFRRRSGVVGPMGVVAIASLMTITMLVWTDSSINIINNVLPSLIFIIGVSDSIHMLVRDAEETEAGADRIASVRRMIRFTGAACLLTSTTTAVGFFSLLMADTEILQNFGWQAGAGVMFAYLVTLLFLPALLVFMRPVQRAPIGARGSSEQALLERGLVRLGTFVLRWPRSFIAGGLIVASVAGYLGSTVEIDTVLLEVYEPGHPNYESTQKLERELSGVLPIEISLEADDADTFKRPEIFAKMHDVQRFSQQFPSVLSTQSIVDFHQAARAALLGDPAERSVMPESREQVEQLHLLIAGAPDSRTGPSRYVTSDFRNARILLRVTDSGARSQLALGRELEKKLAQTFAGTGVRHRITGDAYVASVALDSFIRDLFSSLLFAMVIIFAMMTAVFRSLKVGLISILPNVLPLLMTFGYMGLAGIDLNTTTIIIFAISLGIAVDDTIHFLARFREERERYPDDIHEALLNTYNGAGRAIVITSVMLVVGLIVLLFSNFVPTQMFGKLTAIAIAGAVLGDLLLLPPILYLVYRKK